MLYDKKINVNTVKPLNFSKIIINCIMVILPVGVEHLIALLTHQCFQIPLTPRMFPV